GKRDDVFDGIDLKAELGALLAAEHEHTAAVGDAADRAAECRAEVEDAQQLAAPWRQSDQGRARAGQQRQLPQREDLQQAAQVEGKPLASQPEHGGVVALLAVCALLATRECRGPALEQLLVGHAALPAPARRSCARTLASSRPAVSPSAQWTGVAGSSAASSASAVRSERRAPDASPVRRCAAASAVWATTSERSRY